MLIPNMLLKIEWGQQIKLQLDQVEADLEYEQMAAGPEVGVDQTGWSRSASVASQHV